VLKLARPITVHSIAQTGPNAIILRANHVGIQKVAKLQHFFAVQISGSVKYVLFAFYVIVSIYNKQKVNFCLIFAKKSIISRLA
jgi:hypothetical protein